MEGKKLGVVSLGVATGGSDYLRGEQNQFPHSKDAILQQHFSTTAKQIHAVKNKVCIFNANLTLDPTCKDESSDTNVQKPIQTQTEPVAAPCAEVSSCFKSPLRPLLIRVKPGWKKAAGLSK